MWYDTFMPSKTYKNGRHDVTEFEVRLIDADGDVDDLHCFETPEEAKAFANDFVFDEMTVAVTVEKVIKTYPLHRAQPDRYTVLLRRGNVRALYLHEGGDPEAGEVNFD